MIKKIYAISFREYSEYFIKYLFEKEEERDRNFELVKLIEPKSFFKEEFDCYIDETPNEINHYQKFWMTRINLYTGQIIEKEEKFGLYNESYTTIDLAEIARYSGRNLKYPQFIYSNKSVEHFIYSNKSAEHCQKVAIEKHQEYLRILGQLGI